MFGFLHYGSAATKKLTEAALAISAYFNLLLTVKEDPVLNLDNAEDELLVHKIAGGSGCLRAETAVPATNVWSDSRTLAAGADSIDLTNLARGELPALNMTGSKVQLAKIRAASGNSAAITFSPAVSNGYSLFGGSAGKLVLPAGAQVLLYFPDKLDDVGAAAKGLAAASTDLDATYEIMLVSG